MTPNQRARQRFSGNGGEHQIERNYLARQLVIKGFHCEPVTSLRGTKRALCRNRGWKSKVGNFCTAMARTCAIAVRR